MNLDFDGIDVQDDFDDFLGSSRRQKALEERIKKRQERQRKIQERKQKRQDARDLRKATRMGLSLEEYRALDSEEIREMESQVNEEEISKARPIMRPVKKAVSLAKSKAKEVVDEVEDDVDILENDIEVGVNETEKASENFLAKNKNMLIIGAVAVVGFFVVRKFLK